MGERGGIATQQEDREEEIQWQEEKAKIYKT